MVKQLRSILESILSFHGDLTALYLSLKVKAEDEKSKMLLDHICKQEKDHKECIEKYMLTASEKILNRWIKNSAELPNMDFSECLKSVKIHNKLSVSEIGEIAIQFDNCIIKFYEMLALESSSNDLKEIFECLMKKSKKQEMNFSRDLLWLYDV